jgi:toxin YoeB
MSIVFSDEAWEQYLYWQQNDKDILERLHVLIKDCQRSPFKGIGKPEPLKGNYKGFWSRRINLEHRLIYSISNNRLEIAQCRFHYGK